ncbi:MAG: hypothetical protein ACYDAN_16510 [Candidatus Limnocylindrales bacterium]
MALFVAACGGSAASPAASTGGGSGATSAPGGATPLSTDATGNNAAGSSAPEISLTPGNASALEAMIPDKVGTQTMTKTSFDYSTIPWASLSNMFGSGDLDTILKNNGKTLADVKFAMGVSTSAGATGMPTMVYALQVSGLDASKFVSQLDSSYASGSDLTVGGKTVKGELAGGFGTITYVHGDVVFIAVATEADLNTLVAALP